MPRRDRATAAATLGVALACVVGLPVPIGDVLGVKPAAAETGYYTRKRVNGQWITGRFPKEGSSGGTRSRRPKAVAAAADDDDDDVAEIPLPPAREGERPTVTASLPLETLATETSSLPAVAVALPEPVTAPPRIEETADERMQRLKRALQARADALASQPIRGVVVPESATPKQPATPDVAFASSTPSGKVDAALPSLPTIAPPPAQAALAQPTAATSGVSAPSTPKRSGALEPKSVSYDFETGIKTTVYESSVVREPFDVAAVRMMAGRLPQK